MKKLLVAAALMVIAGFSSAQAADVQEYNVFAVPSKNIQSYVAEFGQEMKDKVGLETFEQKGYLPHATLYLTSFTEDRLDDVKVKLKQMAADMKAFPLVVDGTHLTKGRWFFLDLSYSKDLQRLSDTMVLALEPLRNPAYQIPGWAKNIKSKAKTFARYGSPNVFAEFNPHLTQLAGEKSPKLDEFLATLADRKIHVDGQVVGLGFAPVNPLGQVKKGDEVIYLFGAQ